MCGAFPPYAMFCSHRGHFLTGIYRLWENDEEPQLGEKAWNELTEDEQRAAALLGFDHKKWDMDGDTHISSNYKYESYEWRDLPNEVKKAALAIGYTESIWNNDGELPLKRTEWSELTLEQKESAHVVGYDQRRWDNASSAIPSFSDFAWQDLPENAKKAAKCLKYTRHIWDKDGTSPLDDKSWTELTSQQRQAAVILGKLRDFVVFRALYRKVFNLLS